MERGPPVGLQALPDHLLGSLQDPHTQSRAGSWLYPLCPGVSGRPVTLSEPRSLSWRMKITLTLTLSLAHSGDPDSWASHWMIPAVGNVHDTEIIN